MSLAGGTDIEQPDRGERIGIDGSIYGWRRGWPLHDVAARPGGKVVVDPAPALPLIAEVVDIDETEAARRLATDHHVFLMYVDGVPAAYGWSASGPAEIGGLPLVFTVPPGERYLWDFKTLPPFRGRGLYPLLLQDILRNQAGEAEWFWIVHEPHNLASQRGILKAGFQLAGHVGRLNSGELDFVGAPEALPETTHGAARALGLKHLHTRPDQRHPAMRHAAK